MNDYFYNMGSPNYRINVLSNIIRFSSILIHSLINGAEESKIKVDIQNLSDHVDYFLNTKSVDGLKDVIIRLDDVGSPIRLGDTVYSIAGVSNEIKESYEVKYGEYITYTAVLYKDKEWENEGEPEYHVGFYLESNNGNKYPIGRLTIFKK